MSKKIIAGAGVLAGLAVALAPVATFAARNTYTSDEHTDAFSIRVKDTCAFGNDDSTTPVTGVAHNTGGSGAYDDMASWSNTDTANQGRRPDNSTGTEHKGTDTASYAIEAGIAKAGFATTTLKVYCNNSTDAKYTLTVQMDDLSEGTEEIPANTSYSASASGYAIDSVVKGTNAKGTIATAFQSAYGTADTEAVMATSTTGTYASGDDYTITYGIGVQANQKAATYTGNVVYKLYQGVAE